MNKWKVFKNMMKVGMFLSIIFMVFQVGVMYLNYLNEYEDGSFVKFLTYKEVEEYSSLEGRPSDGFLYKAGLYMKVARTLWIALFFFVMFELFDYKDKPEEHWIGIVREKMDKFSKRYEGKIEEDEVDKDDQ